MVFLKKSGVEDEWVVSGRGGYALVGAVWCLDVNLFLYFCSRKGGMMRRTGCCLFCSFPFLVSGREFFDMLCFG